MITYRIFCSQVESHIYFLLTAYSCLRAEDSDSLLKDIFGLLQNYGNNYALAYLLNPKSFFMHVSQVEHGLGTVLLLCCQAIMNKCSFIINVGAKTIEMIIAKFQSSNSVTYQENKIYERTCLGFCIPFKMLQLMWREQTCTADRICICPYSYYLECDFQVKLLQK